MMRKIVKRILPQRIIKLIRVLRYSNVGVMRNPQYNFHDLITYHVPTFLDDKSFQEAYRIALKKTGRKIGVSKWSLHIALWAAERGSLLDGDFVECGVDQGFMSIAIVHFLDFNKLNKKFYLLDTYEGLPLEYVSEEEFAINNPHRYKYQNTYEQVKQSFEDFNNVHIVKGKVPDTLEQVKTEKIAFLSLDMNNAYPEVAAAEFFWDKLVSGALILLDDYCYHEAYRVQREAFDLFAQKHNVPILTLPTGQGVIIKP